MLTLALYGGRAWWNAEDLDYRSNKMFKPVECEAKVRIENGQTIAQLTVLTGDSRSSWPPLVPDHGKLMHVFLVREPGLDVLAHVHPVRRSSRTFEVALPPLPSGDYRFYADVTHETGMSQTLTALATIPELPSGGSVNENSLLADPDDSWFQGAPLSASKGQTRFELRDGRVAEWERPANLVAGKETSLRFTVREPSGELSRIDPYMGMLAHMAIRRDDGAVFTHLHPAGSLSIAAQQVFQIRAGDKPPRKITPEMMEQLCQPPSGDLPQQPLYFPYEFPKPGKYRLWLQVKIAGKVHTSEFATEVVDGK